MAWSPRMIDGFLLAATVAEDHAGARGVSGLAEPLAAELSTRLEEFGRLEGARRRTEVRRLAASVRDVPSTRADLPPRARALLAREVPRETGSIWMRTAPPPRRGYVAPSGIRAALRRLASSPTPLADGDIAERERAAGRDAAPTGSPGPARELLGLAEGVADAPTEGRTPPVAIDAMIRGAVATAPATARLRALGAMVLGAAGGVDGDAESTGWRRAGRELAELAEAGCRE